MTAILPILRRWYQGQSATSTDLTVLLAVDSFTGSLEQLEMRSQIFQQILPDILQPCHELGLEDEATNLLTLWRLWLPFTLEMIETKQSLGRPLIQGILGGQGTGKTTLTKICQLILKKLGYDSLGLSLDDLYKTYRDRQALLQDDPRLIWRGPPGTHDIDLGITVLTQARQTDDPNPILIPQFDKSLHNGAGDRIAPKSVEKADIILFEGWFTGARPVDPALFEQRIEPIITESDRQFAKDCNERLRDYLPLWDLLDRLLVLYPIDYRLSKPWRREAEQKMKAEGKTGMSDAEIDQFVDYFWKALHPELFIAPLTKIPRFTDLAIEINADHRPCRIYRPATA